MHLQPRRTLFVLGIFFLAALYRRYATHWASTGASPSSGSVRGRWRDLGLTGKQCAAEFPGLEREIENAVAEGGFDLKKAPDDVAGSIQGRIRDGKVCISCAFGFWSLLFV
jgi:hypothetical protein